MSEYQYYEFAAIDRPLTRDEMAAVLKLIAQGQGHEAERHRQREACLRLLMADVDKRWAAIDAHAQRGNASGYEQAVRALAELAQSYALTGNHKTFDRALRRLLVRHATRGTLSRRLTEAGLWSG